MPSAPDQPARCLLCAANCAIGAELDQFGRVRTIFPADMGVDQGACALGVIAGHMITAEGRIYEPRVDGRATDMGDALQALTSKLLSVGPEKVAFCVDLNRPLEGIAAAASLCKGALKGARLCAFIPPQDVAVVSAGIGGSPPCSDIADCDLVLVVGDACSSHPALARSLRDMQRADRRNRLVCVDSAPGRTSTAADEAVLVSADRVAACISALAVAAGSKEVGSALGGLSADEICSKAGLDALAVTKLAGALKEAKSPGIVVACSFGRVRHSAAVLAAAHELARASGAKFWALPLSTNSAALPSLTRSVGLQSMAELIGAIGRGDVEALVVVGFDPASVFPRRIWEQWGEQCEIVAWAGSLESEFAASADIVLPLALAWEESGHMLSGEGRLEEFSRWLAPPTGIPTATELACSLGKRLGVAVQDAVEGVAAPSAERLDVSALVTKDILSTQDPEQGQAWLVGAPESYGYTGGLSATAVSWQKRMAGTERAVLCPAQARELGLQSVGSSRGPSPMLRMRSPDGPVGLGFAGINPSCGGQCEHERVVAVASHWDGIRELLNWRDVASGLEAEPIVVSVEKAESA